MAKETLIRFQNEGQWLYGMLHLPKSEEPAPAVVMLHGFTGQRIEAHRLFVKAARALAAAGIAALRFDFRGSGESEGDFVDMTISGEISDAHRALAFLRERPEVDPARLAVLGLSLGGCVAACLAGSAPDVQALALWAPTALIFAEGVEGFGPPGAQQQLASQGWIELGGERLGPAFVQDLLAIQPLATVKGYTGPAFLAWGTADAAVSQENIDGYLTALQGPTEYLTIPGADHVFSLHPWESEVITATTRWLAATL